MNARADFSGDADTRRLGPRVVEDGVEFNVFSRHAEKIWVCLFDENGARETSRFLLTDRRGDYHRGVVPAVSAGVRYGLRADGPWAPERGHRFDPEKLLIDPYATRIDRPFRFAPALTAPRETAVDTAPFMPRCVVEQPRKQDFPRLRQPTDPRFIYEIGVKAFTRERHDIPAPLRGTLAGLRHPRVIEHLKKLRVSHVELMPIAAWMDERHLPRLGLSNAWGYNPVAFMALDPRLAPYGIEDLRLAVDALHAADISVLLDVVFNHTAESDVAGPTLSLRGLDNALYYRHLEDGALVNDTGCGNTLACDEPAVARLVVDTLRHFAREAEVDGFRFDLATILGRDPSGFEPDAPLLDAISRDPDLQGLALIAEPWDIGPGGYRLGKFQEPWSEWNDRYRDDIRRFWRGDKGSMGLFASRLAGSADIFEATGRKPSASVNFIAAHDGFSLRDLVSYETKHNDANGEDNRDGVDENLSWNCGVEGATEDIAILARRQRDVRALLATLFLSRGVPMLVAGDELGRTQGGNNNAYAQDNATTWLDWARADRHLIDFVANLAKLRAHWTCIHEDRFLNGQWVPGSTWNDVSWLRADGTPFTPADWRDADFLAVTFASRLQDAIGRAHIVFNRSEEARTVALPTVRAEHEWTLALDSARGFCGDNGCVARTHISAAPRSVVVFVERAPLGRRGV